MSACSKRLEREVTVTAQRHAPGRQQLQALRRSRVRSLAERPGRGWAHRPTRGTPRVQLLWAFYPDHGDLVRRPSLAGSIPTDRGLGLVRTFQTSAGVPPPLVLDNGGWCPGAAAPDGLRPSEGRAVINRVGLGPRPTRRRRATPGREQAPRARALPGHRAHVAVLDYVMAGLNAPRRRPSAPHPSLTMTVFHPLTSTTCGRHRSPSQEHRVLKLR